MGKWGFASRVSAQLFPGSCPRYSKVLSAIFQGPVHFLIFLLCNQTFADQLYIGDVQWSEILVYYIIKNLYDN